MEFSCAEPDIALAPRIDVWEAQHWWEHFFRCGCKPFINKLFDLAA
jgi:hypothetical protein